LKQDEIVVKIKTLLVDDSITFLTVARRFLATQPIETIDVIGEAQNGLAALQMARERKPELVLLDLELGDADGFEVLRELKSRSAPPRVVVVTLHDQDEYREVAQQAGADGFIAKREFATALMPLLHHLFEDASAISATGD
jgi:DNA-binding NarL/FixJ family response regulator